MKIIIAGSRDISDYEIVRQAVIESGYWKTYKRDIEVVCGMALHWKWKDDPIAGGVDRWGHEFAKKNGLKVHPFPADWTKHGKAAGMVRNAEMGEFTKADAGRLLAVWDGVSTGTKGMVAWAQQNALQGFIYRTDKPTRYNTRVGDEVATKFSGKMTAHTVVEICKDGSQGFSQSGVLFKVEPAVQKSGGMESWIDADWFEFYV